MSYARQYLAEAGQILAQLDTQVIDRMVAELLELRRRGGSPGLFSHPERQAVEMKWESLT